MVYGSDTNSSDQEIMGSLTTRVVITSPNLISDSAAHMSLRFTHDFPPLTKPIRGCAECVCPQKIIMRLFLTNNATRLRILNSKDDPNHPRAAPEVLLMGAFGPDW